MSSFDKVVKLACKPKAAAPKAKYIDTIIAATYSEDGAVNDVCRALSPKFKEPNAIIVFKALIVLHTMVRNGSTDNVLAYLSSQPSDVLRLRNVSNSQWEGYSPPQNLSNYALYMDSRIRSYKELKHDPIRVQSESNRDLRVGAMDAEMRRVGLVSGASPAVSTGGVQRSKTVMGRKLRVMTVEKGLLRETKIVQKLVDVLLDCQFFLDNLEDELTITALRMLVKDLLVLFQAVNEGVINVLEHYFEMSKVDAKGALGLYRTFCRQTERVVEYLTIARKLQNLINVPIPNLKHAPVSLAGALEEYLNDPNFEQNRIEYKLAKEQAEVNAKNPKPILKKPETAKASSSSSSNSAPAALPAPTSTEKDPGKPEVNKDLLDFFSSIETEQSNMFGTGSPTATSFNQATTSNFSGPFNPFAQRQTMMITGASPFNVGPSPFINVQTTGFPGFAQQPSPFVSVASQPTGLAGLQNQMTGFPTSQSQPNGLLAPGNVTSPFLRPHSAAANLLQPQVTGPNPFRQSMFSPSLPAATGSTSPFVAIGSTSTAGTSPFGQPSPSTTFPFSAMATGTATSPFSAATPATTSTSPFPFLKNDNEEPTSSHVSNAPFIARPASTPITASNQSIGQVMTPLTTQQTGSRNPFGRPRSPPPPPVPPVPTLGELSANKFPALNGAGGQTNNLNDGGPFGQLLGGTTNGGQSSPFGAFGTTMNVTQVPSATTGFQSGTAGSMSSLASAFALPSTKPSSPPPFNPMAVNGASTNGTSVSSPFGPLTSQTTSTSTTTSNGGFSALLSNPTGTSTTSNTPSFLQSQPTGFGGSTIKPFKPSSTFGAALLGALPTIPQGNEPPSTSTPTNGAGSTATSPTGALNAQPTGFPAFGSASLGSGHHAAGGLQPHLTGANPFRASMFGAPPTSFSTGSPFPGLQNGNTPVASPLGTSTPTGSTSNPSLFGSSLGGGAPSPLQSQPTGLKAPFKPSSSFGASLFANMGATGATTSAMPGGFPGTPTAPQQNQQPQNPVSLI